MFDPIKDLEFKLTAKFPVLSDSIWNWNKRKQRGEEVPECPTFIYWIFLDEETAYRNHCHQDLKRLAERGGLSPKEMMSVVLRTNLFRNDKINMTDIECVNEIIRLNKYFEDNVFLKHKEMK